MKTISQPPRRHSRYIHGEARKGQWSAEFSAWVSMIRRCEDVNQAAYARYGGRGIAVYPPWRASFLCFLAGVGRKPSPKHSLDRYPNNNGNYEPGNVRWATVREQSANRRDTLALITFNNETHCIAEWARIVGVSKFTLYDRFHRGLTGAALIESCLKIRDEEASIRMNEPEDLTNKHYGLLVVSHSVGEDKWLCLCSGVACSGTGYRTLTRSQLTHQSITSCQTCAKANKYAPNKPMIVKPVIEPTVLLECQGCSVRIVDSVRWDVIDPNCSLHFRQLTWPRASRDSHLNGATV